MEAVQAPPPHPTGPLGAGLPPTGAGAGAGFGPAVLSELPTIDFVDCYQSHYRRLVRALRLAGADAPTAEDVAQDAFARALAHWSRVSKGSNPTGYVYTAGFRLLAKAQSKTIRQNEAATLPPSPADPTGSQALSSVTVEAALAAMPTRRRSCAVMCLVVGLPAREAAEALGITDGTVRKHLEEARRDLAAVLL